MLKGILIFFIFCFQTFAEFNERGMLPMNQQWWECSMGGPVIQCKVEECAARCDELIKAQKAEKEAEREERIQDIIIESQQQDDSNKNPAIFQVDQ